MIRMTHVILARLARYHWKVHPATTFERNPAEDVIQQLKELLLTLHSCNLSRLTSSHNVLNALWTKEFSHAGLSSDFLSSFAKDRGDSTRYTYQLRGDILVAVFKASTFLEDCMYDHGRTFVNPF